MAAFRYFASYDHAADVLTLTLPGFERAIVTHFEPMAHAPAMVRGIGGNGALACVRFEGFRANAKSWAGWLRAADLEAGLAEAFDDAARGLDLAV